MSRIIAIMALLLGICVNASADIWLWTDAHGEMHMVNSSKPLYTWLDESGLVHYSDTPDHEDAVSVELVWHSTGSTTEPADMQSATASSAGKDTFPAETEDERVAREQAADYYCKRARDIFDSYVNAPRLYETDADGKRSYLDDRQTAVKLEETKSAVAQLCN